MTTDQLLTKIGELFTAQTALLRKEIKESLEVSEKRVKQELRAEIIKSQEETIETLTDVINEGYGIHEKRIKRIEDHLDFPPLH